jgi:predicted glycosyltransferase
LKRFLFFFVHPAKFHAFRATINELKRRGHIVDVLITSKEVLEDLVQAEGWRYKNLFPRGRRIPFVHTYLSAAINAPRTILRLLTETAGDRYDLYVTDDLLTFVGKLRGVPSIFFTDDDITAVPESKILAWSATHIVAPSICRMGRFSGKHVGYFGYKALAHLHPARFTPDRSKLAVPFRDGPFCFMRLVSATSTHDVGKRGLSDEAARRIVEVLRRYGRVLISSQRPLAADLCEYQFDINKTEISHYVAFSELVVSDSTTMCAEAAVLGTPAIEIDDWYCDFKQYGELHDTYRLIEGFAPRDLEGALVAAERLLSMRGRHEEFRRRQARLLTDKIDVSGFLIWLLENYPTAAETTIADPKTQLRFLGT